MQLFYLSCNFSPSKPRESILKYINVILCGRRLDRACLSSRVLFLLMSKLQSIFKPKVLRVLPSAKVNGWSKLYLFFALGTWLLGLQIILFVLILSIAGPFDISFFSLLFVVILMYYSYSAIKLFGQSSKLALYLHSIFHLVNLILITWHWFTDVTKSPLHERNEIARFWIYYSIPIFFVLLLVPVWVFDREKFK